MNIFSSLFGIFRKKGLVETIKEGRGLTGFVLSAVIFSIVGGVLYGFATGIGLGIDTAIKDAIKVGLIVALVLPLSIPIFLVAYRLMGRDEPMKHITAVPLTFVSAVLITLAVTAPVVFFLSIMVGHSENSVYIHIIIVDLAFMVGLYVAGTFAYHSFPDHRRLVIPNVVSFLMTGVIFVVLMNFLGPFLAPYPGFSKGTDRLMDGLGINVDKKADQALSASMDADRMSYRYQNTNENGDLIRDYTVTRVGNDYMIAVHLHAVAGDTFYKGRNIWVIDGQPFTDFDNGAVKQVDPSEISSLFDPALPSAVFSLPEKFAAANWRALESGGWYTITGTTSALDQVTIMINPHTGQMVRYTLGRAEQGLHAEVRAMEIGTTELDAEALLTTLHKAFIVGSIIHTDAYMDDYFQDEALFLVRYPENWREGVWNSTQQNVKFTATCQAGEVCPDLTVSVFDLIEGKDSRKYAGDLGESLGLQDAYRDITVSATKINGETVGVVEYYHDVHKRGYTETTQHIVYVFEGKLSRYHLDYAALDDQFEDLRDLFAEMAELFVYLKVLPY